MIKSNLTRWSVLFLLVLFVTSCDDEVLTGQFNQETCFDSAEPGKMRASIDELIDFNVEVLVSSDDTYSRNGGFMVTHENGFQHLYIGALDDTYGIISMDIINPEVGIHDLATINEFGFTDNSNNHELLKSFGLYNPNGTEDTGQVERNYVSYADQGGSGQVEITELDLGNQIVSGTFSFIGNRLQVDPVSGDVILDGNGNPIIETIEVSCGNFNSIPYTFLISGGNTGPFFTDFYAEVDGSEFVENMVTVDRVTSGGNAILYIKATSISGKLIRIDIPEDLGEGTFTFEPISDGSKLTALFNNNNGSETLTANPGTITISNFDRVNGVIEATFSFTGTDPFGNDPSVVEVTNGDFKLSFNSNGGPSDMLSASVDGVAHETSTLTVVNSEFIGVDIVTISTLTAENQSLSIVFPKNIEVGSYNMSPNVTNGNQKVGLYSPDDGVVTSLRSNSGSFSITSYDMTTGEIEGTFEFEAIDIFGQNSDEYAVTSGSFSVVIPD